MIENASIDPNISGVLPTICISEVAIIPMRSAIICAHIRKTGRNNTSQRGNR